MIEAKDERQGEKPTHNKNKKPQNNNKSTTTKIYIVSLLKPINATRKTDPTDFSGLCSKLMNNKSSLYFISGETQPIQDVTVPVKHPG